MEDYYTYYVLILGISEELFWGLDVAALRSIEANKVAYDAWKADAEARAIERG